MVKKFFLTIVVAMVLVLTNAVSLMFIENRDVVFCESIESEVPVENTAITQDVAEPEVPKEVMVTISGTVVYDNYTKGYIEVYWVKDESNLEAGSEVVGVKPVILDKLGAFLIEAPKNAGSVNIVINYYDQVTDVSSINDKTPKAAFLNYGPIMVGSDNIEVGELRLEESKNLSMEDYKGLTVKISGKVTVDKYEKGLVKILVLPKEEKSNFKLKPSYIVAKELLAPGDYVIKVPQGIGNVYVYALNIATSDSEKARGNMSGTRTGSYVNNPLNISLSDFNNVDIIIK